MDLSSIALQGLQQADLQLQTAASQIAGATGASNGVSPDVVSLSEEMVALMSARTMYDANVATLKTTDNMQSNLLDMMA